MSLVCSFLEDFAASFGQMLHNMHQQIVEFVTPMFIKLVKKTERNIIGKQTEMLVCLFIF